MVSPRSGRAREVPLSKEAALAVRSLTLGAGSWVFGEKDDELITMEACKWPLWQAAARAKPGRRIGWHVFRLDSLRTQSCAARH